MSTCIPPAKPPAKVGWDMYTMIKKPDRKAAFAHGPWKNAKESRFIVDPRTSRWLPYWDVTTSLMLLYTATLTPYEVAFLQPPLAPGIIVMNRIVDVVFVADLALNFFLSFPTDARQSAQGAHWVRSHAAIVRHYLAGWFAIDFLSCTTWVLDVVETGGDASQLKMLRVIRVLRLAKMLRLLRGMRLLQRWETRLRIDYGMLSLAQSMALVVIFAHWSACCWMLQVGFVDHLDDTWLFHARYCIEAPSAAPSAASLAALNASAASPIALAREARALAGYSAPPPPGFEGFVCLAPSAIYSAAFYWAVMTITSVGYGDIIATPRQPSEQVMHPLSAL